MKILSLLICLNLCFLPVNSYAHQYQAKNTPVMVIRYNQENVYFEKTLNMVIQKAKDINSNARFKLVACYNAQPNAKEDIINKAIIVKDQMIAFGVNEESLIAGYKLVPEIQYNEIRIYVY